MTSSLSRDCVLISDWLMFHVFQYHEHSSGVKRNNSQWRRRYSFYSHQRGWVITISLHFQSPASLKYISSITIHWRCWYFIDTCVIAHLFNTSVGGVTLTWHRYIISLLYSYRYNGRGYILVCFPRAGSTRILHVRDTTFSVAHVQNVQSRDCELQIYYSHSHHHGPDQITI